MSIGPQPSKALTRSQIKKPSKSAICTCSEKSQQAKPTMNEQDKEEIAELFTDLVNSLRKDLGKHSKSNTTKLFSLRESIEEQIELEKRSSELGLKPDYFKGSIDEDANQWLDF